MKIKEILIIKLHLSYFFVKTSKTYTLPVYHINSELVYCEMGELCNTTEGGWTRLAYLDMSDSTVDCLPGFNCMKKIELGLVVDRALMEVVNQ